MGLSSKSVIYIMLSAAVYQLLREKYQQDLSFDGSPSWRVETLFLLSNGIVPYVRVKADKVGGGLSLLGMCCNHFMPTGMSADW